MSLGHERAALDAIAQAELVRPGGVPIVLKNLLIRLAGQLKRAVPWTARHPAVFA